MRLISKGEFAKERRVSAGRVSQWLHDGRVAEIDGKIDADQAHAALDSALDRTRGMRRGGNITSNGDNAGGAGTVSPIATPAAITPAADAAVEQESAAQHDGQAQSEPLPPGEDPGAAIAAKEGTRDTSGYWEHKAKREKFEAELAEMKYLATAGALVNAPGVRKEAMEAARAVRNAMLAIPDRIAPVLDPANPARAHKLLTGEIQKVLRELSLGLEQRAAAPAGPGEPALALL